MSSRPNLPNIYDLQIQVNNLEADHCKLLKEYKDHLIVGSAAGLAAFLTMMLLQTGLTFFFHYA